MTRPNVLVLMTDDHAAWASGAYGNTELRTPTLDHLAETGVRMGGAFTPTPVCSPARACFWTGRLPSQHGVHDYLAEADPEVAAVPWLAGETTLAERFHDAGYVTGLSGKWHLGGAESAPDGFDYWYARSAPVARPQAYETPWPRPAPARGGYDRHAITDHAVEFLRNRPDDRPFFLFVGHVATHSPWLGHPERLVAPYRTATFRDIPDDVTYPFGRLTSESVYGTRADPRAALAQYYASVSEIDEQAGRLLDELDTQRLRADTLVVYTSDHGLNTGHHGIWGKGNGTHPYNMVEESIRVPMILNRPGGILGGQVRQEMVTHLDLAATLLDHAGIVPDDAARLPGRSFHDLCLGKAVADWPDAVFGEYGDLRMVRTARHKLVRRPGGPCELFDLAADPRETVNLFADAAHAGVVDDLTTRLDAYFGRYADPVRSGLRVRDLPRHNAEEAWRDDGSEHAILLEPTWLKTLE
jgi:arylsulfatase A-like enzyme